MKVQFICHPRCSTCDKARKWLDDKGISYEVRDIRNPNPTEEELRNFLDLNGKIEGIIVEEKGLSSHTANIAARKGIPTVVAAENAMDILKDHQEITIETDRGIVYDGIVKVL